MPDAPSIRPGLRFLLAHPAHFIACGLGSGLSSIAPGTVGTLFAWFSYHLVRRPFDDFGFLAFLAIAYLVGIWACQRTGRDLGAHDHGAMVWDEIVPFWFVLLLTPDTLAWQLGAFLLFRGFDISKPQPARYFNDEVKNGFGVMADDLVAAGYTLLVLAVIKFVAN